MTCFILQMYYINQAYKFHHHGLKQKFTFYTYKAPTCEFLVKLPKYLLKLHSTHLFPTLAGFDERCLLLLRVPKHLERVYVALCNNLVGNLANLKAQYLQENRGKESSKRRFIFPYRYFDIEASKTNQFVQKFGSKRFQNKASAIFVRIPNIFEQRSSKMSRDKHLTKL